MNIDYNIGKSIVDNFKFYISEYTDIFSSLRCNVRVIQEDNSPKTTITYIPYLCEDYINKITGLLRLDNVELNNDDTFFKYETHPATEYICDIIKKLEFNKVYLYYSEESYVVNKTDIINQWFNRIIEVYSEESYFKRFILNLLKYIDPKYKNDIKSYFLKSFNLPKEFIDEFNYNGLKIRIGWDEVIENKSGCFLHICDITSENGIYVNKNGIPDIYPNKQHVYFDMAEIHNIIPYKNYIIEPQVFEKLKFTTTIKVCDNPILRFYVNGDSFIYNNNINGMYQTMSESRSDGRFYDCIICNSKINYSEESYVSGFLFNLECSPRICNNTQYGLFKYLNKEKDKLEINASNIICINDNAFVGCRTLKELSLKDIKQVSPFSFSKTFLGYKIDLSILIDNIDVVKKDYNVKYYITENNENCIYDIKAHRSTQVMSGTFEDIDNYEDNDQEEDIDLEDDFDDFDQGNIMDALDGEPDAYWNID